MKKIILLLISLLLLALITNNAPAFDGAQSLVCYFHETVYDIQFVDEVPQDPAQQCGLPEQQEVIDNPNHNQLKTLDVHDPECFSWVYH